MSFFFQTSAENLSCQQHERQFRQFRPSKTSQETSRQRGNKQVVESAIFEVRKSMMVPK